MPEETPVRLRLQRSMRLRQTREFTSVRNQGQRSARGCMAMNWLLLPAGSGPRLGVITSRKLGKAHVRTRARRLLREAFRRHQHEFRQPAALVLIARNSIVGKHFADVERDFLFLAGKAALIKTNG